MLKENAEALSGKFWIVADCTYDRSRIVFTPQPGKLLSISKNCFNYRLSSARTIIDQVLGVLVAEWAILWRALRVSLEKESQLIIVCCKVDSFIIDYAENKTVPINEPSDISATVTEVHLQSECTIMYGRRRDREESSNRDNLTELCS